MGCGASSSVSRVENPSVSKKNRCEQENGECFQSGSISSQLKETDIDIERFERDTLSLLSHEFVEEKKPIDKESDCDNESENHQITNTGGKINLIDLKNSENEKVSVRQHYVLDEKIAGPIYTHPHDKKDEENTEILTGKYSLKDTVLNVYHNQMGCHETMILESPIKRKAEETHAKIGHVGDNQMFQLYGFIPKFVLVQELRYTKSVGMITPPSSVCIPKSDSGRLIVAYGNLIVLWEVESGEILRKFVIRIEDFYNPDFESRLDFLRFAKIDWMVSLSHMTLLMRMFRHRLFVYSLNTGEIVQEIDFPKEDNLQLVRHPRDRFALLESQEYEMKLVSSIENSFLGNKLHVLLFSSQILMAFEEMLKEDNMGNYTCTLRLICSFRKNNLGDVCVIRDGEFYLLVSSRKKKVKFSILKLSIIRPKESIYTFERILDFDQCIISTPIDLNLKTLKFSRVLFFGEFFYSFFRSGVVMKWKIKNLANRDVESGNVGKSICQDDVEYVDHVNLGQNETLDSGMFGPQDNFEILEDSSMLFCQSVFNKILIVDLQNMKIIQSIEEYSRDSSKIGQRPGIHLFPPSSVSKSKVKRHVIKYCTVFTHPRDDCVKVFERSVILKS